MQKKMRRRYNGFEEMLIQNLDEVKNSVTVIFSPKFSRFSGQHVVKNLRVQVSVFRLQDLATCLPDTRNLMKYYAGIYSEDRSRGAA